ncbi:aig2 family protein [Lentinula edodes]|uniref:Aig2 family protein n=1 Tax=Lentinula edodes TaxID=5353 RepID=A0A1Q3E2C6_LENED|nr:aig2 family protein [Lentinula edodes]
MERRCPESEFVGVGILRNWRWFINERGVANLIYRLNARDEATLDRYEGSPEIYQKVHGVPVEVVVRSQVDVARIGDTINTLIYIDQNHVTDGKIRQEYIPRMHRVMEDGIREGIPPAYFDKYFKPFVPLL